MSNKQITICKQYWSKCKGKQVGNIYININLNSHRKLSNEAINLIFEYLVQKGFAIFVNQGNRDEIFILWKSLLEWEEFIYNAAAKHHRIETIETLEYIVNDEDNMSEEFYGMDKDLLVVILNIL